MINAHQHILEKATSKDILEFDEDGNAHHLTLAPGASAGVPSGVFKPYAGVSTAVLFFTRGAKTRNI